MNSNAMNVDDLSYMKYTGPQMRDKALHTLEGILVGIRADEIISDVESQELKDWCRDHARLFNKPPFSEIAAMVECSLSDGVMTAEELMDLKWVCKKCQSDSNYFDTITSDIQRLQGILHGILADGVITKAELDQLSIWMEENSALKGCYPYDEIDSLITSVLKDGVIDCTEQRDLAQFFDTFIGYSLARKINQFQEQVPLKSELSVVGICACCPEITFPKRLFCFTGLSIRAKRSVMVDHVHKRGGDISSNIGPKVDFLVVGAGGNPSWAFSCYGRKIETAVNYRKAGQRLLIIHENDFWDAVQDTPVY